MNAIDQRLQPYIDKVQSTTDTRILTREDLNRIDAEVSKIEVVLTAATADLPKLFPQLAKAQNKFFDALNRVDQSLISAIDTVDQYMSRTGAENVRTSILAGDQGYWHACVMLIDAGVKQDPEKYQNLSQAKETVAKHFESIKANYREFSTDIAAIQLGVTGRSPELSNLLKAWYLAILSESRFNPDLRQPLSQLARIQDQLRNIKQTIQQREIELKYHEQSKAIEVGIQETLNHAHKLLGQHSRKEFLRQAPELMTVIDSKLADIHRWRRTKPKKFPEDIDSMDAQAEKLRHIWNEIRLQQENRQAVVTALRSAASFSDLMTTLEQYRPVIDSIAHYKSVPAATTDDLIGWVTDIGDAIAVAGSRWQLNIDPEVADYFYSAPENMPHIVQRSPEGFTSAIQKLAKEAIERIAIYENKLLDLLRNPTAHADTLSDFLKQLEDCHLHKYQLVVSDGGRIKISVAELMRTVRDVDNQLVMVDDQLPEAHGILSMYASLNPNCIPEGEIARCLAACAEFSRNSQELITAKNLALAAQDIASFTPRLRAMGERYMLSSEGNRFSAGQIAEVTSSLIQDTSWVTSEKTGFFPNISGRTRTFSDMAEDALESRGLVNNHPLVEHAVKLLADFARSGSVSRVRQATGTEDGIAFLASER